MLNPILHFCTKNSVKILFSAIITVFLFPSISSAETLREYCTRIYSDSFEREACFDCRKERNLAPDDPYLPVCIAEQSRRFKTIQSQQGQQPQRREQELEEVVVSAINPITYCQRNAAPYAQQECMACFNVEFDGLQNLDPNMPDEEYQQAAADYERRRDQFRAQQMECAATANQRAQSGSAMPGSTFTPQVQEEQRAEALLSAFDEASEKQAYENSCRVDNQKASECCIHPERCFGSVDGVNSENEGVGAQIVQMIAGTALSVPSNSIVGMCSKMKDIARAATAANSYLAYRCNLHVNECRSTCQSGLENFSQRNQELVEICERSNPGAYEGVCSRYRKIKLLYTEARSECGAMNNQAVRLGQQAVASQTAQKFAEMCRAQAQNSENVQPNGDPFSTDCGDPANLSKPACVQLCLRPENANQPGCQAFLRARNGQNDNSITDPFRDMFNRLFNNVPDGDVEKQGPQFSDTEAKNSGVAQSNTGGGGGGLPGGGDSGGLNSNTGGEGGSDSGYDTDIENGMRSGGGSGTVYSMGSSSGSGGSSYGSGKGLGEVLKNPSLNIKDFLPGGKKAGNVGALRGLASMAQDISPAHTDIFKKVTDRFYQVCLRDGLLDCASMKKVKGGGR